MGGSRIVAAIMPDAGGNPRASDDKNSSFEFSPPSPQSTAASAMECDCDTSSPHRDADMSTNSPMAEVVRTMMKQEDNVYAYERYRPPECQTVGIKEKWRQDICHWVSKMRALLLRFAPNRMNYFACSSIRSLTHIPLLYLPLLLCRLTAL